MYSLAVLSLGGKAVLPWAIGGCLFALVLLLGGYARVIRGGGANRRAYLAALVLKALGIGLLGLCLVEPLWTSVKPRPGENLFVVLVDQSASLQVRDHAGASAQDTRGAAFAAELSSERPWMKQLEELFDVRRGTVSDRLTPIKHFDALEFNGSASRLCGALAAVAERYRDRPVAGVLLFTDGQPTDRQLLKEGIPWDRLPPIYPVLPADHGINDVAIERWSLNTSPFEDAPVTLQADIQIRGSAPPFLRARLLAVETVGEKSEKLVEEQVIPLRPPADAKGSFAVPLRFAVNPPELGIHFYQLQVEGVSSEKPEATSPGLAEDTPQNNHLLFPVVREKMPHRVLYVSGRPNWEFKFLRRAMESDHAVQMVGLIRIAKKEAKFDFRGRTGEKANPLFRGFGKETEDAAAYDQPVFVRVNTRDEHELRGGFPTTKAGLYEYDALILDDLEAEFFTREQQVMVERFVSERGGGLLMLGGVDTFRSGRYQRTPIADALPVFLDRGDKTIASREPKGRKEDLPAEGYRLQLQREGWLQNWVRLRPTEVEERERLALMPEFQELSQPTQGKPSAQVLATMIDRNGIQRPALVAQSYGTGKSAAILIGDLWRWSLERHPGDADDLGRAWRQTLRWLVTDVPHRIDLTSRPVQLGETEGLQLQVRLRTEEFRPLVEARVQVTIREPDGRKITIDAEPTLQEPGLFAVDYVPRQSGAYRAEAHLIPTADATETSKEAKGPDGPHNHAELGWVSDPAAAEFQSTGIDRPLMEDWAARTKGEVLSVSDLESWSTRLAARPAPIVETHSDPLWHSPWMLLSIILMFVGEAALRRTRGLP